MAGTGEDVSVPLTYTPWWRRLLGEHAAFISREFERLDDGFVITHERFEFRRDNPWWKMTQTGGEGAK